MSHIFKVRPLVAGVFVLSGLSLAGTLPAQGPRPPRPRGPRGGDRRPAPPPLWEAGGVPASSNYSLLSNPVFDAAAIRRAESFGLTDSEVGEAAALAARSGVPLSDVLRRVESGATFASLAAQYDVSAQTLDGSAYTDLVRRYLNAYDAVSTFSASAPAPGLSAMTPMPGIPPAPSDAPPPSSDNPALPPPPPGGPPRPRRARHGRGRRPAPPPAGAPDGGPPPPPNGGPPPPSPG